MAAEEPQLVDQQEFIDILDYNLTGDNDTVERKRLVIQNYREEGSIYHAALNSRVSRKTVYRWIESDPEFAQAIEESKEDCYDKAETSVFKKALAGDSLLLMFYLKAHRHKFRDKVSIDVESVRDEIQQRMEQLGLSQLPPAMITTSSVVGSGNQVSSGLLNSLNSLDSLNSPQFPHPSEQIQKELPDHNPQSED